MGLKYEEFKPGGAAMGGGIPMGCVMDGITLGAPKLCMVFDEAITCQPNTQTHTPILQKISKCDN